MRKVYVVSSWRNPDFDDFVKAIADIRDNDTGKALYEVYNFKTRGVSYHHNKKESGEDFWKVLDNEEARGIFRRDMKYLRNADIVILLLPSGKSAHLELGFACGLGKDAYVVLNGVFEPEITYLMAGENGIIGTMKEMLDRLGA